MPEEQNQIQTNTAELSSPMDLLEKSYVLYKSGFKKFVAMMLVPVLGAVPLIIVLAFFGLNYFFSKEWASLSMVNLILGFFGIVSVIFLIIVTIISQAGLYILARDAAKNLTIKQAFLEGKKIAWKFFVVSFATGIFAFFWALLFIIPGIWAAINYSFALWVFLYEGVSGTGALKRSKKLVEGYWWQIFGKIVFLYILLFAVTSFPGMIIKAIPNSAALYSLWNFISNIISFLFTPLAIIYTCYMYWDIKRVKEGKSQNL